MEAKFLCESNNTTVVRKVVTVAGGFVVSKIIQYLQHYVAKGIKKVQQKVARFKIVFYICFTIKPNELQKRNTIT